MSQTGLCRRTKETTCVVIKSDRDFMLRVSASCEFVTATVVSGVKVEVSGNDIIVTIATADSSPATEAENSRIYVPDDIPVVVPTGKAYLDDEAKRRLGSNMTER